MERTETLERELADAREIDALLEPLNTAIMRIADYDAAPMDAGYDPAGKVKEAHRLIAQAKELLRRAVSGLDFHETMRRRND